MRAKAEAALTAILDAIEVRDGEIKKKWGDTRGPFRVFMASEIGPNNWDWAFQSYENDPIGQALRAGIRDLGRTVAPFFTAKEMLGIAAAAADKNDNYGRRIDIVDKNWDGIRFKGELWVA